MSYNIIERRLNNNILYGKSYIGSGTPIGETRLDNIITYPINTDYFDRLDLNLYLKISTTNGVSNWIILGCLQDIKFEDMENAISILKINYLYVNSHNVSDFVLQYDIQTSSFSIQLSHFRKKICVSAINTPVDITIPHSSIVLFPLGFYCDILSLDSTYDISVILGSGAHLLSADNRTKLRVTGSSATIDQYNLNYWSLVGDIIV